MDRYFGNLTEMEIERIASRCPELATKVTTEFLIPDERIEASLETKFQETIIIQH